jgi:hypothetical protein
MPQEASDVISQGLIWFLSTGLEVPWVSWTHVHALEIFNENFLEIGPTLDTSGL